MEQGELGLECMSSHPCLSLLQGETQASAGLSGSSVEAGLRRRGACFLGVSQVLFLSQTISLQPVEPAHTAWAPTQPSAQGCLALIVSEDSGEVLFTF